LGKTTFDEAIVYRRLFGLAVLAAAMACDGDGILGPGNRDSFRGCPVAGINLGTIRNGSLTTNDCQEQGYFTDYFEFQLNSTREVIIDLVSNDFDAFLELYDRETGAFIEDDDNDGFGNNAHLQGFLPAGRYIVGVSSFFSGETGNYSLAVE
jgi:hypothetical protein